MRWICLVLAPVAARAEDLTACDKATEAQYASNFDLAITNYSHCLKDGSLSGRNRAITLYNRGATYLAKNQDDAARADFDAAIGLMPELWPAYSSRGLIYFKKGDYDSALADYDTAIRRHWWAPDILVGRGNVHDAMGNYNRALADFNAALRRDDKNEPAYVDRGATYDHMGDYDHAIADEDVAIRLDSGDPGPRINRALARIHKGEADKGHPRSKCRDPARSRYLARLEHAVLRCRNSGPAVRGDRRLRPRRAAAA